ncbi:MAG: hypothetical protein N3D76_02650, partial [Geminocystis sp.]|nr:hypothetical protein [Geminocystis sp.]
MKRPTFFIGLLLTAFWTEEIKALETKAQSFQPDSLTQDFENVWFLAQANGVNESSPPPAVTPPPGEKTPSNNTPTATPRILSPSPNTVLDGPSATVVIQFPMGTEVELRVNGKVVPKEQIGEVVEDSTNRTITQTWYGVTVPQGESVIELYQVGESKPVASTRVVTRGGINSIRLQPLQARIPADGKSTATIEGQLLDERGNRSRQTAIITLSATRGEFVGKDAKPELEGFQVEAADGTFTATLKSGLQSGDVTIRAATVVNNKIIEGFTQILFETNLRPPIVTGVLDLRYGPRGTDFYSRFRDFLPPDKNNDYRLRAYGAFFGTGRIGEWSFTGAYNSFRTLSENCAGERSLFRTSQNCEPQYPVYGDESQVTTLTPSYDSVYLRLERTSSRGGIDYFMWGDFKTEELANPAQQLTALERSLHGFKMNYNLGDLQLTGFYNVLGRGFQRDNIAPDGTSGFYFLSRRGLIAGSETIAIETVELQNPSNIIDRKVLKRGEDYEIDYDRGSLLFRTPVSQTTISPDGSLLRRQIVATYEYNNGEDTDSFGGQARYFFSRNRGKDSWIGASYFRESQGVRRFTLFGANTQIYFSDDVKLVGEYGYSESISPELGLVTGSAYRLELEALLGEKIKASAYYRSTDAGFTNNANLSFTPGQTRYGARIDATVSPDTTIRASVEREENRGVAPVPKNLLETLFNPTSAISPGQKQDNDLTTVTFGVAQKLGAATVSLDYIYRDRVDRIGNLSSNSSQLRSRLTTPLGDSVRLTLQNEMTLGGAGDAVYNDRTTLGVTWEIAKGLNLTFGQQWYHSGQLAGKALTTAELAGEYKLGEDTTLIGKLSSLSNGQETATQGTVGLRQRWVIAEGLQFNFSYERVFGKALRLGTGAQFNQAYSRDQTASSLALGGGDNFSASLKYNPSPDMSADFRFEKRNSSAGSNTVISASAVGKVSPDFWLLGKYEQAKGANQGANHLGNTVNIKLGLAYRPVDNDTFNALLKYEYRRNPSTIPETILFGAGTGYEDHTFSVEAIYAPSWQWEFYGKYAFRNTKTYMANDFVAKGAINLAQFRATYRFEKQFDLTGEARFINQSTAGYSEVGWVAELGYWLSPNLRLAVGYSSGKVNVDRDFNGSRSAGGLYVGLTVKFDELFDGFGLQRPLPPPPPPPVTASGAPNNLQANTRITWNVSQSLSDKGRDLSTSDRIVLDNLAVVLQASNALILEVNTPLTMQQIQNKEHPRAQKLIAIRDYLMQKGISSSQIVFRATGSQDPTDQKISFTISGDLQAFRNIVSSLQAQPNSPAKEFFDNLLSQIPAASPPTPPPQALSAPRIMSQTIEVTAEGKIADTSIPLLEKIIATAHKQTGTDIELVGDINRVIAIRRYLLEKGINSERIVLNSTENTNLATNGIILSLIPSTPAENIATTPPTETQWETSLLD